MSQSTGKLISELKVHELRAELIGRGLDGNGVKTTLVSRLEKALSEQGVDINTYLFIPPPVNQASPDKSKAAAVASAEPVKAAANGNDAEKDNQPEEEQQQEEVDAEDLVEKVDDEPGDEQVNQENNEAAADDNDDPDIGDLEERQESEEDEAPVADAGKSDVTPMEVDASKNESKKDETTTAAAATDDATQEVKTEAPKPVPVTSNTSAIHVISDEEDVDYEEGDLDAQTTAAEKKESESEANVTGGTDPSSTPTENKAETSAEATTGISTPASKPSPTKQAKPAGPKVPSGLKFPADDPQGLRCLWIRGIPAAARTSELKLAFMDAGFRGEVKIFCPKQTATSKQSAFGFVTLETKQMAADAVRKMHNSIFKGKTISVERACDSSMLQSDLVGKEPGARNRSHPPIKPPEKPGNKKAVPAPTKSPRTRTRPGRGGSTTVTAPGSGKSNYLDKIRGTRIVRHPTSSSSYPNYPPPRRGASTRVVGPSSSYPSRGHHPSSSYSTRGTRPSRGSRHMSPPVYVTRRRSPSPPSRHHSSSYRDRNHGSEDRDRKIIEERYEEALRRKDEERRQRERELKLENERVRERLEKERLAKENLELKLKLAQVSSNSSSGPSRTHRPSPPPSSSSRRPISPVRRHESTSVHRSPDRRPPPSSSSYGRHGAPVSPRRGVHRSRSPRPRSPPRFDSSRGRRPSPPRGPPVGDRDRSDRKPSYRGGAPPVSAHRFDSRGERDRETRPGNPDRYGGGSRDDRPPRRGSRDYPSGNAGFDRSAGSSAYPSRRSGNEYERGSGSNAPVPAYGGYNDDYRGGGGGGSSSAAAYSTSSRNPSTSAVPSGSTWPAAPTQYAGSAAPPAAWSQAPTMPTLAQSWNQFPQQQNVRGGNTRGYGQY